MHQQPLARRGATNAGAIPTASLNDTVERLRAERNRLTAENTRLRRERDALKSDNVRLRTERDALKSDNTRIGRDLEVSKNNITHLTKERNMVRDQLRNDESRYATEKRRLRILLEGAGKEVLQSGQKIEKLARELDEEVKDVRI